ncbi:hypothetical protein NPIL_336081 [Nephila pilipes]|uniref:Uncharacterized protein n=1 Tax=Nephila pilipes TaxID=299642 RepID=A0A8X6QDF8_NEPPI|nr:hypothetical protein NPIL_336081 [Nephila pilipes]
MFQCFKEWSFQTVNHAYSTTSLHIPFQSEQMLLLVRMCRLKMDESRDPLDIWVSLDTIISRCWEEWMNHGSERGCGHQQER